MCDVNGLVSSSNYIEHKVLYLLSPRCCCLLIISFATHSVALVHASGYPLSSAFAGLSEREAAQANVQDYIEEDRPQQTIYPVDVCQKAVDSTSPLHHAVKK